MEGSCERGTQAYKIRGISGLTKYQLLTNGSVPWNWSISYFSSKSAEHLLNRHLAVPYISLGSQRNRDCSCSCNCKPVSYSQLQKSNNTGKGMSVLLLKTRPFPLPG